MMGCEGSKSVVSDSNNIPFRPNMENVDLPKEFRADRLVIELHKAITDNKYQVIISMFYKYNDTDYVELASVFEDTFRVNLVSMCHSKLAPETAMFVNTRLNTRLRNIVMKVKASLADRDYTTIVEIICAYSELDLLQLQEEYRELWDENLPDALVNSHLDDEVRQILLSLLSQSNDNSELNDEDHVIVRESTLQLVEGALNCDLFENKMVFLLMCSSKTRIQLREIFEGFLQKCGRDMTTEIERFYWEDREKCNTLVTLVDALRKKEYYFAEKIKTLLNKDDTESRQELIFTFLSRPENVSRNIRDCYKKKYLESLSVDIDHDISDHTTKLILHKHLAKC